MNMILSTFNFIKFFTPLLFVWVNIYELQTTIIDEVKLNNDVKIYLVNCTYQSPMGSIVYCTCPKSDANLDNFICQCYDNRGNRTYKQYTCSCVQATKKIDSNNCKCVSLEDRLTVKCNILSGNDTIKLGILIPHTLGSSNLSSYFSGRYYSSAMFIAKDDINQNKFLLKNRTVDLVWGNTDCNKSKTIKLAIKMIEEYHVDAIVGVGCEGCLSTAEIAGAYNIPMISHMCMEKELSDKKIYPTFARTAVTGVEISTAIHVLLKHFRWTKVSVILEESSHYKQIYKDFRDTFNGEITMTRFIRAPHHYCVSCYFQSILNHLKEVSSKSKIIICLISTRLLKEYLVAASQLKMADGRFVFVGVELDIKAARIRQSLSLRWITAGFHGYDESVNTTDRFLSYIKRSHELCEALPVLLILIPDLRTYRANNHFGDRVINETKRIFNSSMWTGDKRFDPPNYAWGLYDAILLYANAVNNTINKGEDFRNGFRVMQNIKSTTFQGAGNFSMFVDKNLEARQPFRLYRYGKNDTAKKSCQCLLTLNLTHDRKPCVKKFPKMEEIGQFEVEYVNESSVKDGTDITFFNVKYQYKPVVNAPMHWPGKKTLRDVTDSLGDDSTSKVMESKSKSKSKVVLVLIPIVSVVTVLIIGALFTIRRRRLLGAISHRKMSETELVDNFEIQEV